MKRFLFAPSNKDTVGNDYGESMFLQMESDEDELQKYNER